MVAAEILVVKRQKRTLTLPSILGLTVVSLQIKNKIRDLDRQEDLSIIECNVTMPFIEKSSAQRSQHL